MLIWNKAAIAKHLWAVEKKKDSLWIKWLHIYYIKNYSIEDMPIPRTAAWVVRKILETRKLIMELQELQGGLGSRFDKLQKGGVFSIKKLYKLQFPQHQKVQWKSIILQPQMHPRFKFILWLALHGRLATVERLWKFGIHVPQQCIFCDSSVETRDHLFFDCPQTRELWMRLLRWIGFNRLIGTWQEEVEWISRQAKKRNGQCAIVTNVFGMLINGIWRERNRLRFQGGRIMLNNLSKEIAIHIHTKGEAVQKWKETLKLIDYYPK